MTCLQCEISKDLDKTIFLHVHVLGRVFRVLSSKIAIRKTVKDDIGCKIRSRLSIFVLDIYLLT